MAHYDLDAVKAAARADRVEIPRKDSIRYREAGLTRDDVCGYLASLREQDFDKTHLRDGGPAEDSYIVRERDRWGERTTYIKFSMFKREADEYVLLVSIHL